MIRQPSLHLKKTRAIIISAELKFYSLVLWCLKNPKITLLFSTRMKL